jgi:hypothetical protein
MNFGIDQVYFAPCHANFNSATKMGGAETKNAQIIEAPPSIFDANTQKTNLNRTLTTIITHLDQIVQIL